MNHHPLSPFGCKMLIFKGENETLLSIHPRDWLEAKQNVKNIMAFAKFASVRRIIAMAHMHLLVRGINHGARKNNGKETFKCQVPYSFTSLPLLQGDEVTMSRFY